MTTPTQCQYHPLAPSKNCRVCKTLIRPVEQVSEPFSQIAQKSSPKKQGIIPIHGDKHTFNLSSLVRKNLYSSHYFNELLNLKSFNEVLTELITHCTYVEPWTIGTNNSPSTLFCCLYRVFSFKISEGQMKFMLEHENVYVRCAGALYLRILCAPDELWPRLKHYLTDPQSLSINQTTNTTFGEFVEQLLIDQNYYGLQLPRIPILSQREIIKNCLFNSEKRARFAQMTQGKIEKDTQICVFLDDGTKVKGVFKHAEGRKAQVCLESGEMMHVGFGDIQLPDSSLDIMLCDQELETIVKQRELDHVLADSKTEYARRPQSYKSALSLPMVVGSKRQRSRSPSLTKEVTVVQTNSEPSPAQIAKLEHLKLLYCGEKAQGVDLSQKLEKQKLQESDNLGPETLRLG